MIPVIQLKKGSEEKVLEGHPWIYRNELDLKGKGPVPGALVTITAANGRFLGTGFFNPHSQIAVRVFSRDREVDDETKVDPLVRKRIQQAVKFRAEMLKGSETIRLIYSEADGLSGLVVDQYKDALVMQCNSRAMRQKLESIVDELKKCTGCSVVVDRSDVSILKKEGLKAAESIAWKKEGFDESKLKDMVIKEGDLNFKVDLQSGQKTGFYLDQRNTRAWLRNVSKDKKCLDAFCHSGGLSVAMAKGGAASVLSMDSSQQALELAVENMRLNKVEAVCEQKQADLFKSLNEMQKSGNSYDLIVLDPPGMTHGKSGLGGALRGYKEINFRAMKMLAPDGLLLTCSCTQAVSEEKFRHVILMAAKDAGMDFRQVYQGAQPLDHPQLLGMPESHYLKVLGFQKIS